MKQNTAFFIALASGLLGAVIGAIINLIIAKTSRKHEIDLKKQENKRIDNIAIATILAEIKISISKIEVNSRQFVHDKINYWRFFYAQEMYREQQKKDKLEFYTLQKESPEKIIIELQIEQRGLAILEGPKVIKEQENTANKRIQLLNEEISKLVFLLTKLSILSGKNLSDLEKIIIKYQTLDFGFINFDSVQEKIKNMNDEEELNNLALLIKEQDEEVNIALQKSTRKIQKELNENNFF